MIDSIVEQTNLYRDEMSKKDRKKQVQFFTSKETAMYVLLAMAYIKEDDDWKTVTNEWIRIYNIIQFVGTYYGVTYAENSRETIRKQALHHFRTAILIEDNCWKNICDSIPELCSIQKVFGQSGVRSRSMDLGNARPYDTFKWRQVNGIEVKR